MKAFTDYPISELGDPPNKEAPIREVEVISYDSDKYCLIEIQGIIKEIKWGYLYRAYGRCGEVAPINPHSLPVDPNQYQKAKSR